MLSTKPESIWTVAFALLCATQFLGYAQQYLLQPTFALYVTHLGGTPFALGLVIASFGIISVLSRPFIGYYADYWSKTGVLILGLLIQTISMMFCFIPSVGAMIFANGLRGIGWSGMNTGGFTLLATNAPVSRRGEASGYYSGAYTSAAIIFPAIALWIINASFGGFQAVFIAAMVLTLLGAVVGVALSYQTTHDPPNLSADSSGPWWRSIIDVFDRNIALPAVLLFCLNLPTPCLSSFVVLYAKEIGISHFGWYFVATGVINLFSRPLLGRVSDKIGVGRSIVLAYIMEIISLLLFSVVTNIAGFILSGALFFLGTAIGSATLFTLAIEKALPERRGRAMASYSVSFPLSYSMGGLLSGFVVGIAGYKWMFMVTAVICALGFVPTSRYWSQLK